jgi:hypothetical protein
VTARKLVAQPRADWEKLIRWLSLASTTKAVAYAMATFADNKTGENVRPGERLLAQATGLSTRAVREHIGVLMEEGLLYRASNGKYHGRRGWASVFVLCAYDRKIQLAEKAEAEWNTGTRIT